jgi:hypothetical protein
MTAIMRPAMPKSKAENHKEAIMSAVEDETESEAIAEAAKAAQQIRVADRIVRPEDLSAQVEKALDGAAERFHLKFDDGSELYLATTGGILTATVSK